MLEFNPSFRPTAADILKNKLFNSIRIPSRESPASHVINMPIYDEGQYDYEECESVYFNQKDYI